MAQRRKPTLGRDLRLTALEQSVKRPPDEEHDLTLGQLRAKLDAAGREIVSGWLAAFEVPEGSTDCARLCCRLHAMRRVYRWLRAPEPVTVGDLIAIEIEHACP